MNEDEPPEVENRCENESIPRARLIGSYLRFLFLWQTLFHLSDVGLSVLLSFFATLLLIIARVFGIDLSKTFAGHLPVTVHAARIFLGRSKDSFTKRVCCPSCSTLYPIEKCSIRLPNGTISSLKMHLCTLSKAPSSSF